MLVLALGGCHDTPPTEPQPLTAASVDLPVFSVSTFEGARRLTFRSEGRYAILPQFAASRSFASSGGTTVPFFAFTVEGNAPVSAATVSASVSGDRTPAEPVSVAEAFHYHLRELERENAARLLSGTAGSRRPPALRTSPAVADPEPVRSFKVLSSLTSSTYATVSARLVYAGANALLYVDAQAAGGGLSDAEYAAMGRQFDGELYPVDVQAFGGTSDIDANSRTFVLFTPMVNRLTLNAGCGTYVAGFFDSTDLAGDPKANGAEVLYAAVAGEPTGGASCAKLAADVVRRITPSTLIHELQHLISFSQHVISRQGPQEDVWLNEGLSHLAEELGGRVYESRYPCPSGPPCPSAGRSSVSQIFPDSAQGFLIGNFANANDYLASHRDFSLTSPTRFASLEERAAAWLFLRWLVDQKGDAATSRLVQTTRTGAANIEAVGGDSFRRLFSDFLVAVLLDDFPTAAPGQIPSRYQFASRNLRATYSALHAAAPGTFFSPYPLDMVSLPDADRVVPSTSRQSRSMKPGTFDLFEFRSSAPGGGLTFQGPTGGFAADLFAQVTIVRLPD